MEGGSRHFRSIKKAMAIVPKLDVKVVNLGKNLQVLGYNIMLVGKFSKILSSSSIMECTPLV